MTQYLSRSDAEDAAAQTLRNYSRQTGRRIEPPIPVDMVGELLYDLRWEYGPVEGVGPRTLAALYPNERVVRLNERYAARFEEVIGLDHFTKGHEIGHWVLHVRHESRTSLALEKSVKGDQLFCRESPVTALGNSERSHSDSSESRWVERQADWFAAGLLMPKELVIRVAQQYHDITWEAIREMSNQFEVSRKAFRIRLENLGLIYVDAKNRICRSPDTDTGQTSLF